MCTCLVPLEEALLRSCGPSPCGSLRIYYPDEASTGSWADGALGCLGYYHSFLSFHLSLTSFGCFEAPPLHFRAAVHRLRRVPGPAPAPHPDRLPASDAADPGARGGGGPRPALPRPRPGGLGRLHPARRALRPGGARYHVELENPCLPGRKTRWGSWYD